MDARLHESLDSHNDAQDHDENRGGQGEPMDNRRVILPDPNHETSGVDHHQADDDKDGRQSHAEGHDQQQTEADTAQGNGAEKDDKRGRAWNDPPCDPQRKKTPVGDRFDPVSRVRMRVGMVGPSADAP